MRYLILSDVHANLIALEAVLDAAKGRWQKVACLGDLVGYGPDPNEVVERIRALGAITIRGNHDKVASGIVDAEDVNPMARDAALWTREKLRPKNREFLAELSKGPVIVDGFTMWHGAYHDEDEYVFSPLQAVEGLVDASTPVAFFGHTHIQGGFKFQNDQVSVLHFHPTDGKLFSSLTIETGSAYLLNPGSIGQPRDGDPRSGFAIADLDNLLVEFWRIPYDIGAVQNRMTQAGLPEPLILRLSFGR
jgi:predicted phosphodiesterase